MKSGLYPSTKNLDQAQNDYIEKREQGMYNPLVGGIPKDSES